MTSRQAVIGIVYLGFTLLCLAVALKVNIGWGILLAVMIAAAGSFNYVLGWTASEKHAAESDPIRDAMRVTPPLEQRHVHAILAFGENSFGPMDLDDDHDEALDILRQHVRIPSID